MYLPLCIKLGDKEVMKSVPFYLNYITPFPHPLLTVGQFS